MTHQEAVDLIRRAKSAIQDLENEAAEADRDDAMENYAAAFGHLCDALDSCSLNTPATPAPQPTERPRWSDLEQRLIP